MASFQQRLLDLIGVMKTETKALRAFISGTNNGNVSGLATAATNLVSAINEVKATADAAGGAAINDGAASGASVYSSSKTMTEINAARAAVKDEILGGAGPSVDTLIEIANALANNPGTDAALAAVVANKANTSDIYTQAQLGDPDTNLVTLWNAA